MDSDGAAISALWVTYKASASREARDRLILHYSPLVKYVAERVSVGLPQNIEHAGLVSYGIFGLIDAIEKFDPARKIKFETYAIARIKGAIMDEVLWSPSDERAKSTTLGDTIPEKAKGLLAQFEGEEQRQLLAAAINRLGEREKMVLVLYYYEGFTLAQIGEVLGVSEQRAEALHEHALSQLPKEFPDDFGA